MKEEKPKKSVTKIRILLFGGIFLVLCVVGVGIRHVVKKANEAAFIHTQAYYISTTTRLQDTKDQVEDPCIIGLYRASVKRDPKTGEEKIALDEKHERDLDYPFYESDGANLYFDSTNYEFIFDDWTNSKGTANTWCSCGIVFDQVGNRTEDKNVILIRLSNQYFMNSSPLTVLEQKAITIGANSIIVFQKDCILAYEFVKNAVELKVISMNEDSILDFGNIKKSYYSVYQYLCTMDTDTPWSVPEEVMIHQDFYHYFLGTRYDFDGETVLYQGESGYILENGEIRYLLDADPLYFVEERALTLPSDYVLVQPNQYCVYQLPRLTKITMDEYATYIEQGEKIEALNDIFLYDGDSRYIVFDECTLVIGKKNYTLSPLSYIDVLDSLKIGVYDYDSKEYTTLYRNGNQANLEIFDSITIDLVRDVMRRRDGKEELLVKEPSLLSVLQ